MPKKNFYKNKTFLYKRYVQDKKTPEEIAIECQCTIQTIYVYLNKFGLRSNGRGKK